MPCGIAPDLPATSHRPVAVHQLAQHGRRRQPRQSAQLERAFGVAAPGEHAACIGDGDCIVTPTRCGLPHYCAAYLNKAGLNGLQDFLASWDTQQCGATIDCAACPGSIAPARCADGVCKPKQ